MSAELEKLAKEYSQRGFVDEADSLFAQARIFAKGGMPEHFGNNGVAEVAQPTIETPKVYPEISLKEEMDRQAIIATKHFAAELGMSEKDYIATLPDIFPQPEEYKGLFDLPVRVEPRIDWQRQADLSGIIVSNFLKSQANKVRNWDKGKVKFETPAGSFIAWASSEVHFVNRRPSSVRSDLTFDHRGGKILDGISFANAYPESVRRIGLDLIGDSVGSGDVPYLLFWSGRPRLNARWLGNADPGFRTLVLGSKIGA